MKDTKERPIHVGKCYTTCPEKTKGQHFLDCEFHALDLTERDFSGSAFTDCVFEGVAADRGQWADTEFSYCKIRHSSFISATLSRSTFTECIGTKNDYRYAAFRSTTRIGGREDEPSIEGMDITNSLFDQFVLFLAKGSAVGIEAAVYTITDGKPGAVYLYQKGMPLLFAGYGWNNREGSRPERVEEMPETIQRFYRKFRHIQKKEATASVKTTAGKILEVPKPRQQFGVLWDYQPTPDPEDRYRAFVPVTLIYGDPSPDVPNLIQGWTTDLPKGDKATWDDAVRRVTQREGELTCKDCDGTGDTLEEALERAEKAWDEKKALLKLADQVAVLVPDYRERILPNASRRLQEAKKADTLTLFSKLQIEDAKEDLHQRETEFLKKLARRLRHTEPTSETIQAVCQAMHEDNTPWNQKEALFDRCLQKAAPFLYAPLRHRIEALQKELLPKVETEGFEGALSVYQDAVKTYFRAKREFRLAVLHLSQATGKGIRTCFLALGARERAFFEKEVLKEAYKKQNQGKDHPLRAAIEELDDTFTPRHYVHRLSKWLIVSGIDVPKVQTLLQRTEDIFYVTATSDHYESEDGKILPGTLSVRPIEYDERLHAMDILYPPRHKDTARSHLFPRTIGDEENRKIIAAMIHNPNE